MRRTAAIATALAAAFGSLILGAGVAAAAPADGPMFSCRSKNDDCRQPGQPPVSGLPEPSGTMSQDEFIGASVQGAQQSRREHGVPVSVTIAQAILESGWGKSALSTVDKNFFGMKCNGQGSYALSCASHATSECTAAGACFPTTASFRKYGSAADSFRDHGATLASLARYNVAFTYKNDPDRFVAEMHKAGYATDPQYTVKLTAVMAKYNLYQYDLA
jgi:flagellum-specific peptidoglycan hydrolase FlgJ